MEVNTLAKTRATLFDGQGSDPLSNDVIRVYDEAGNMIETHEHTGDFRKW